MLGECLKFHNKAYAVCEYVCVREVVWLCGCGNVPSLVLHMNWLWNYLIMWGCELITSACSDTHIYMVIQPIMYTLCTQCTGIPNGVQILAGGINKKNLQTKITSIVLWSHLWIKVMTRTVIKKERKKRKQHIMWYTKNKEKIGFQAHQKFSQIPRDDVWRLQSVQTHLSDSSLKKSGHILRIM